VRPAAAAEGNATPCARLVAALWRDEAFWKERGGRCVVYGPPCTLSERAAPVAALAVAFDDDVVCSTSLGSVLELRDRLRALAGDAPLCERLLAADVAPALARKALQDLRLVVPPRDKLRPAGSLFLVEPRRGAAFGPTPLVGVDATEFSELHLRSPGNHSPIFYLRALIDFQPYACLHKGASDCSPQQPSQECRLLASWFLEAFARSATRDYA